jgi:hypothetical protein
MSSTPLSKEKPMKSPAMPPRDTAKENGNLSLALSHSRIRKVNTVPSSELLRRVFWLYKYGQRRLNVENVVHGRFRNSKIHSSQLTTSHCTFLRYNTDRIENYAYCCLATVRGIHRQTHKTSLFGLSGIKRWGQTYSNLIS